MTERLLDNAAWFITGVAFMWLLLRHRLRRLRKAERTFEAWTEDLTPVD